MPTDVTPAERAELTADPMGCTEPVNLREMGFGGFNPKWCRCCTCGHIWAQGKDGSHSCTEHLLAALAAAERRATDAEADLARRREDDEFLGEFGVQPLSADEKAALGLPTPTPGA